MEAMPSGIFYFRNELGTGDVRAKTAITAFLRQANYAVMYFTHFWVVRLWEIVTCYFVYILSGVNACAIVAESTLFVCLL